MAEYDASENQEQFLIRIESAHLTKNVEPFFGRMDPFVQLSVVNDDDSHQKALRVHCTTPTDWDAHFHPHWSYDTPPLVVSTSNQTLLQLAVHNDTELHRLPTMFRGGHHKKQPTSTTVDGSSPTSTAAASSGSRVSNKTPLIGQATITVEELLKKGKQLHGEVEIILKDIKEATSGTLCVKVHILPADTAITAATSNSDNTNNEKSVHKVDPTWFDMDAVRPLSTSGGTAAFFQLTLSDAGLKATSLKDANFFVGKDLSHAQDEKDFYQQLLDIKRSHDSGREDVAVLAPFMFDYLGILEITTTEESTNPDGTPTATQLTRQLLVMENLRNKYQQFRMLDLKIGQVTAQAGWKGKSRLTALKATLVNDTLTNSAAEGYRLAGFDGCNDVFDSLDPLIDFLAPNNKEHPTTVWGAQPSDKQMKTAKRIMINTLDGTEVLRYFMDVHTDHCHHHDDDKVSVVGGNLLPIEMAEIVFHEIVTQLVQVAVACHQVQVPQKWIGSSVALGYDVGLLPPSDDSTAAADTIRDKVIVKLFDWGRSELLTRKAYESMTPEQQADRKRFWDYYRAGIDHLAFNAARAYYHQFTNVTQWMQLTLKVMDFDSMSKDDYIGTVTIDLPADPSTATDLSNKTYKLSGSNPKAGESTLTCSIAWLALPEESRLKGTWRVTIERAANLPVMDITNSSDPYCIVIASDSSGREFQQRTCIKARCLNPIWNETLDLPVVRKVDPLVLSSVLDDRWSSDSGMATFFQWDHTSEEQNQRNVIKEWSQRVAASARELVTSDASNRSQQHQR